MELSAEELEQFAAGDPALFERLVGRYQQGLYQLCLRMTGDREEAWDLAQECFLRIYRKAALYDPAFPLTPWVYRLATRVVLNHLDKRRRRPSVPRGDDGSAEPPAERETAPEEALRLERERMVHDGLDELPTADALILRLRYLGELTLAEVAAALGITVQATKTRLFRARARLKDLLEAREGDVGVA